MQSWALVLAQISAELALASTKAEPYSSTREHAELGPSSSTDQCRTETSREIFILIRRDLVRDFAYRGGKLVHDFNIPPRGPGSFVKTGAGICVSYTMSVAITPQTKVRTKTHFPAAVF